MGANFDVANKNATKHSEDKDITTVFNIEIDPVNDELKEIFKKVTEAENKVIDLIEEGKLKNTLTPDPETGTLRYLNAAEIAIIEGYITQDELDKVLSHKGKVISVSKAQTSKLNDEIKSTKETNGNIDLKLENPTIANLKNIIENEESSISDKVEGLSNYIKNHPDVTIDDKGIISIGFNYKGKHNMIFTREKGGINITKTKEGVFISRHTYYGKTKNNVEELYQFYSTEKGPQSEYTITKPKDIKSTLSNIIKIFEKYETNKSENISKANENLLTKKSNSKFNTKIA